MSTPSAYTWWILVALFYFVSLFAGFCVPTGVAIADQRVGFGPLLVASLFAAEIGVAEIELPVVADDIVIKDLPEQIDSQLAIADFLTLFRI
jgi:hypothetical protein